MRSDSAEGKLRSSAKIAAGIDQAEGLRRLLVSNQTQVITLVSGKQGVGRTSVTLNLASALAGRQGCASAGRESRAA